MREREFKATHSLKPEVYDPNPRPIPERIPLPKQSRYVRFMGKNGTFLVFVFVLLVFFAYSQIMSRQPKPYEVMVYGSVFSRDFDMSSANKSAENYLLFSLLTEFMYHGEKTYAQCAVAYKILGGAENEKEFWFYITATYQVGHHENGKWICEDKGSYIPITLKLFKKPEGGFALKEWLDVRKQEMTVEDVTEIMPRKFAARIVGHETAFAQLQADVEKILEEQR